MLTKICDILFPKFYFKRNLDQFFPPVSAFFYHQINPNDFNKICRLIKKKEFQTLTFNQLIHGVPNQSDKSLILSMDDGWSTVYSVAFPLAKRYGLKFTLFINPLAIENSEECRSTLEDENIPENLINRDLGHRCMLTWGEVQSMYESGLVDIQSHSLHHGVVFNSPALQNFVTPEKSTIQPGNIPLVSRIEGLDVANWHPPLGTPLYTVAPALATPHRYIENEKLREQCINFVQENGGANFFCIQGWQDQLLQIVSQGDEPICESDDERRERYRSDLSQAKQMIQEQVPGTKVQVFSPPWGLMHPELPQIAKETGHELIVAAYPLPQNIQTSPLPIYPRLKGSAIWPLIQGPIQGSISFYNFHRRSLKHLATGAIP